MVPLQRQWSWLRMVDIIVDFPFIQKLPFDASLSEFVHGVCLQRIVYLATPCIVFVHKPIQTGSGG